MSREIHDLLEKLWFFWPVRVRFWKIMTPPKYIAKHRSVRKVIQYLQLKVFARCFLFVNSKPVLFPPERMTKHKQDTKSIRPAYCTANRVGNDIHHYTFLNYEKVETVFDPVVKNIKLIGRIILTIKPISIPIKFYRTIKTDQDKMFFWYVVFTFIIMVVGALTFIILVATVL